MQTGVLPGLVDPCTSDTSGMCLSCERISACSRRWQALASKACQTSYVQFKKPLQSGCSTINCTRTDAAILQAKGSWLSGVLSRAAAHGGGEDTGGGGGDCHVCAGLPLLFWVDPWGDGAEGVGGGGDHQYGLRAAVLSVLTDCHLCKQTLRAKCAHWTSTNM